MVLNMFLRGVLAAFHRIDDQLTEATYRHGRYCIADGKLRASQSGQPAADR